MQSSSQLEKDASWVNGYNKGVIDTRGDIWFVFVIGVLFGALLGHFLAVLF